MLYDDVQSPNSSQSFFVWPTLPSVGAGLRARDLYNYICIVANEIATSILVSGFIMEQMYRMSSYDGPYSSVG